MAKLTMLATVVLLTFSSLGMSPDSAAFDWRLPPGLRPPPVPANNPMNEAKVQLGRRLFYDQRMSINWKRLMLNLGFAALRIRRAKNGCDGSHRRKHSRRAMSHANVAG
jgi:cytochrome c peroxidase